MASYTTRGLRRRRARQAAGAVVMTASLLSMYAAALRVFPTYASAASGPTARGLAPRTPECPETSTLVADDTALQAAVAASDDSTIVCITADITLSATLELDDTSITLVGGSPAITLTAPAANRHIRANFDDTSIDTLRIESLTLSGGRVSAVGGGSVFMTGQVADVVYLVDDTFAGNAATGSPGGAVFAQASESLSIQMRSVHMVDNSAVAGGAVAAFAGTGTATIVTGGSEEAPSVFDSNTASGLGGQFGLGGGAIWSASINGSTLTLAFGNVDFIDNDALGEGGAISTYVLSGLGSGPFGGSSLLIALGDYGPYGGVPVFEGNTAAERGGAIASNGFVFLSIPLGGEDVEGAVFQGNAAKTGGAVAAPLVLARRARFSDNVATEGGGAIALDDSSVLVLADSLFERNIARTAGGAVYSPASAADGAYVQVSGVTFVDNQATTSGGAVYLGAADAYVANTTLSGNSAGSSGGALWLGGSTVADFLTVTGNTADDTGGGIYAPDGRAPDSLSVSNSIFWDDSAPFGSDVAAPTSWTVANSLFSDDTSYTLPSDDSGVIVGEDPLLGPLTDNGGVSVSGAVIPTFMPSWLSPVLDAGSDGLGPVAFDQRGAGFPRMSGSSTDMGAVERQYPNVTSVSPSSGFPSGGTSVDIYGSGFLGIGVVAFGNLQARSFEIIDDTHVVAVTPASAAGRVDVVVISGPHQSALAGGFTFEYPTPQPTVPGAPIGVVAAAGDASATVTWAAPASSGSSPITGYRVTGTPAGSCETVELTCTVTGLTNGQPYAFRVEASNSAGTGPASADSDAVTPTKTPVDTSILIVGSRDATAARPFVVVDGSTTGLAGATVVPRVRLPGEPSYATGVARPTVNAEGDFTWTRRTGKKVYVYFTSGDARSNRVVIPAEVSQPRDLPGVDLFAGRWDMDDMARRLKQMVSWELRGEERSR